MKVCCDCGADISLRHPKSKRCVRCSTRAKAQATVAGQRIRRQKFRDAGLKVPRAKQTKEQHEAALAEARDVALSDARWAEVKAARARNRLTLTVEDCWRGAGSMAGAWEGAEA